MNKKISLYEFCNSDEKLAIHVTKRDQAKKLCKAFHMLGKTWIDNYSYLKDDFYSFYKNHTCYSNDGRIYPIELSEKKGCNKIYEFEEVELNNSLNKSVKNNEFSF